MTITGDKRLTDEQLEEKKQKELKQKEKTEALRRDIRKTFASAHGRNTLRWLMQELGYQNYTVAVDPQSGEINPLTTVYNATRQGVYIKIRTLVSLDTLRAVENKGLEQDEDDEMFT